jgi:hypothetical protein
MRPKPVQRWQPGLARAGRRWNGELPADSARRTDRNLAVTWNRSSQVPRRIGPDCVVGALADRLATVVAKVAFEVPALQAARLIVSASTCPPPIGGSRPSSRYDAIISRAASSSIARASSTVGAHVTTAGHSANWAIVQPFSSGVKTAVSVTESLIPPSMHLLRPQTNTNMPRVHPHCCIRERAVASAIGPYAIARDDG